MRDLILQPGSNFTHSGSIGVLSSGRRAMDSVHPCHSGIAILKRGKRSTRTKTRRSKCLLDSAIDNTSMVREAARVLSKRNSDSGNDSQIGRKVEKKVERRVLCPFWKHGSKAVSCRVKGFSEVAKIRDHLKQVHGFTPKDCDKYLSFKTKEYTRLELLEEKWKHLYRRLFPHIPEDQMPSPYGNEEEHFRPSDSFYDDLPGEIAKELNKTVSLMVNDEHSRTAYNITGEVPTWMSRLFHDAAVASVRTVREKHSSSARSSSVDSAINCDMKESNIAKVELPLTPPVSHQGSPRMALCDEGYFDQSPALTEEVIAQPVAHTYSAAIGSWPSEWCLERDSTFANGERCVTGLQPSWVGSTANFTSSGNDRYFDRLYEHDLQSSSNINIVSAVPIYPGHAPSNVNTTPFSTFGYQPNGHNPISNSAAATSTPVQESDYLFGESSDPIPENHSRFEEQSQECIPLLPPSTCLDDVNDDFDMKEYVFSANEDAIQDRGRWTAHDADAFGRGTHQA